MSTSSFLPIFTILLACCTFTSGVAVFPVCFRVCFLFPLSCPPSALLALTVGHLLLLDVHHA